MGGRVEAVAAHHFAIVAGRHDDFVDAEAAPEFNGVVGDEFGEA